MNDIVLNNLESAENLPSHLLDHAEEVKKYLKQEKKPNTIRAYYHDFEDFKAWCDLNFVPSLPANKNIVVMYLKDQAKKMIALSSIRRKCAAIKFFHERSGHESPTTTMIVKAMLSGIKNEYEKLMIEPDKKEPITAYEVKRMIELCKTGTLTGARDRLILAIGFSGAFRRSETVSLFISDLKPVKEGFIAKLRYSKTGARVVPILNGKNIRAGDAVNDWLEISKITEGNLIRRILKGGKVGGVLSDKQIARIVKHYGALIGLDPKKISGHSLRSGFLSSAADANANMFKMMDVSGQSSVKTVMGYVKMRNLFENHAGASFL